MENASYDIDDILNEVRKRREENEANVKGVSSAADETVKDNFSETEKEQTAPQEKIKKSEAAEPKDEELKTAEHSAAEPEFSEPKTEERADYSPQKAERAISQNYETNTRADKLYADDGSVDLFELSNQGADNRASAKKNKSSEKWHKTKSGKICISVIVILCAAIIAAGVYGWFYVNNALDKVTDHGSQSGENLEEWGGMNSLVENFDPIYETGRADISSYRDMVKKWYYNGTPASSTHVLNVLLIGEDTRDEEIEETGYRADSAIIASVNTDTGKIALTSILRDSYVYWETTEGDESTGQFGKINGAMSTGGLNCYINCVEHMFKVNIDNYVLVNFDSFETIVDTLGGVTVELTRAEIREINNHQKTYNHVTIEGEPGELQLDGKQALAYCRIRHIDGDDVRADRQKTVLLELFKKMKSASTIKTTEVVTDLLPYVKTGFSKSEILSIGKYALSHGWLNYETVTYTAPTNETEADGTVITTCKGGTNYGTWIWKVDFPLCAQLVQNKIYGKTNIVLAEKRPKFLELSNY